MSSVQTISLTPSKTVNSKPNQLKMNFPYPFASQDNEIALSNLFVYYSWRNVTSSYGNNTVSYTMPSAVTYSITFPDGYYSIADISAYIQLQMFNNGHYLVDENGNNVYFINLQANSVYYRTTLTCTPIPLALPTGWTNPASLSLSGNCPILNITNAAFGTLLGFSVASYPAVTQGTTYQVNSNIIPTISPTTSINVTCNMVSDSKFNIFPQNIYTFSPNVAYGAQIQIQPLSLLWYRIVDGFYPAVIIELKDQNNVDLGVLDVNMTCSLVMRPRGQNY